MKRRFLFVLGSMTVCWALLGMDVDYRYRIREVSVSFFLAQHAEVSQDNISGLVAGIAKKNLQDLKNSYDFECGLERKFSSIFRYNLELLSKIYDLNCKSNHEIGLKSRLSNLRTVLSASQARKGGATDEEDAVLKDMEELESDFHFLVSHGFSAEAYPEFVSALRGAGMVRQGSVTTSDLVCILGDCSKGDYSKYPHNRDGKYFRKFVKMMDEICGQNDISDLFERLEVLEKRFVEKLNIDVDFAWKFPTNHRIFGRLFSKPYAVLLPYPRNKQESLFGNHSCCSGISWCQAPAMPGSLQGQRLDGWRMKQVGAEESGVECESKAAFKSVRSDRRSTKNEPPRRLKLGLSKDRGCGDTLFSSEAAPSLLSAENDSWKEKTVLSPYFGAVGERRPCRRADGGEPLSGRRISFEEQRERGSQFFFGNNDQQVSRNDLGYSCLELSSCQQIADINVHGARSSLTLSSAVCSADLYADEEVRRPLSISLWAETTEVEREEASLEFGSFDLVFHTDGSVEHSHLDVDPCVHAVEAKWMPHLEFSSQPSVVVNGERPLLRLDRSVFELDLNEKAPVKLGIGVHPCVAEIGERPVSLQFDEQPVAVFDVDPGSSQLTQFQSSAEGMLRNSFARLRQMYKFIEPYGDSAIDGVLTTVRRQFAQARIDSSLLDRFISFVQGREGSQESVFSGPIDLGYLMNSASEFDRVITGCIMGVFSQIVSESMGGPKLAISGGYFPGGNVKFNGISAADYFEGTIFFNEGELVFNLKMEFNLDKYWHDVSLKLGSDTSYFLNASFKLPFPPSKVFGFEYAQVYHLFPKKTLYIFGKSTPGLTDRVYCCVLSKDYLFFGDVKCKVGSILLDDHRVASRDLLSTLQKIEVIRGNVARADGNKYAEAEGEKLLAFIDRLLKEPSAEEDKMLAASLEKEFRGAGATELHSSMSEAPLPLLKKARIYSTPPSAVSQGVSRESYDGSGSMLADLIEDGFNRTSTGVLENLVSLLENASASPAAARNGGNENQNDSQLIKRIDFEEEEEDLDDDSSKNQDGSSSNS